MTYYQPPCTSEDYVGVDTDDKTTESKDERENRSVTILGT